jgi:hypothetical protein
MIRIVVLSPAFDLRLRVTRVLDSLHATIGLPQTIVVDNEPDFAGRALDAWAYGRGVNFSDQEPVDPNEAARITRRTELLHPIEDCWQLWGP